MCLSKLNRRGIQRRLSTWQRLTTLFGLGCWLIAAGVCLADVIVKVNVSQSALTTTGAFDLNFGVGAEASVVGPPPCPEVIAALVLNTGETLTIDLGAFVQDGNPVEFEINGPISPAAMTLLANRLQTEGLYNPAIHDLAFVDINPNTCTGLSHVEVEYGVRDGANEIVLPPALVAGADTLEELLAGEPLLNFVSVNAPVERPPTPTVPAVSKWGLLALTLFFLVVGKIHFGTRRAQTAR